MRDLSFFLRLHALPPLARPSGSGLESYRGWLRMGKGLGHWKRCWGWA